MTIEDRVRQLMTDAVADEPPPRGAPLERALRRRRRRPALAGAAALILVLAAVVGLVAVRGRQRPVPPVAPTTPTLTTLPTAGWPEVTDDTGNFRFRHPPSWEARRIGGQWALTLRGVPRSDQGVPAFEVRVIAASSLWRSHGYWQGSAPEVGRLPAGQAYLLAFHAPGEYGTFHVDWGRTCRGPAKPGSCQPRSVQVEFRSFTGRSQWDRYRAEVQTVVATLEKLRPTAPTAGDRTRPACRAEQWKLVPPDVSITTPGEPVVTDPVVAVPVGVGFRGGRPCHLRAPVVMAALQDGRAIEVRGNPAPATIELDLPEDALPATYRGSDEDRMLQIWVWNRPCQSQRPPPRPVTFRRVDLVFSDERGRRLLATHFNQGPETGECGERGRPSVLAPWP
jgi:hypothetical protein